MSALLHMHAGCDGLLAYKISLCTGDPKGKVTGCLTVKDV